MQLAAMSWAKYYKKCLLDFSSNSYKFQLTLGLKPSVRTYITVTLLDLRTVVFKCGSGLGYN